MMAGKNRSSILAAILQNPEMLRKVYEDSQTSEGSALKENEKYMDSIAGHQERLKNSFQELWKSSINTDTVKFFIDLGTTILGAAKKINIFKTALGGIGFFEINKLFSKDNQKA